MDQKQLNAIKERVANATPGPWLVEESRYEGRFNAASVDENYDLPACLMGTEDAEFVTHAREDVPALITEVEMLHKALEQIMEVEAPIAEGWETRSYKIARQALEGEAHD